jgi:hypothetical protein
MNISAGVAVGVVLAGLMVILIGYVTRHRRGRALLPLGSALIVGSLSPLTRGQVPEAIQILFSAAAIVIAATGLAVALFDVLPRRQGAAGRY